MKKLTLLLITTSTFSFAGGFGSLKLKDLNGIDQKGCSAGKVIEDVYLQTGINFIENGKSNKWGCSGVTSRTASDKKCPYPQYALSKMSDYNCYSNSEKGPVVCVSEPSSETIDVSYGDSDAKKEEQPRFKELFVIQKTASGYREEKRVRMDSSGCAVSSVRGFDNVGQMNNGTYELDFNTCAEFFDASLNKGDHYPRLDDSHKFCEKKKKVRNSDDYIGSHWTALKKLNHCFEDFPNFLRRYKKYKNPEPAQLNGIKRSSAVIAQ